MAEPANGKDSGGGDAKRARWAASDAAEAVGIGNGGGGNGGGGGADADASSSEDESFEEERDDTAMYGASSQRRVVLLKVPKTVLEGCGWARKLETGAPALFHVVSGDLVQGGVIATDNGRGGVARFKMLVTPAAKVPRARVISADVGAKGENVRFEGVVEHTATLMPDLSPSSLGEEYLKVIAKRTELAETRTRVVRPMTHTEQMAAVRRALEREVEVAPSTKDEAMEEPVERSNAKRPREAAAAPSSGAAGAGAGAASAAAAPLAGEVEIKRHKKGGAEPTDAEIRAHLFQCFSTVDTVTGLKKDHWSQKDLRQKTGVPVHRFAPILAEIAQYHQSGVSAALGFPRSRAATDVGARSTRARTRSRRSSCEGWVVVALHVPHAAMLHSSGPTERPHSVGPLGGPIGVPLGSHWDSQAGPGRHARRDAAPGTASAALLTPTHLVSF